MVLMNKDAILKIKTNIFDKYQEFFNYARGKISPADVVIANPENLSTLDHLVEDNITTVENIENTKPTGDSNLII